MKIKTTKLIFAAGILLLLYGAIEIIDCLSTLLIVFNVIENPYPEFAFSPINITIENNPWAICGAFLFFTSLRIIAGIGLLKNRMWGFWLAIFVTAITSLNIFILLPLSALDAILGIFVISLLLMGYFESKPIVKI